MGKTFPAGEKCLTLDYAFQRATDSPCDLRLSFDVRRELGGVTWAPRDGSLQQVPAFERHEFHELQSTITLNPQEFLVIGPSAKADNEYLVGSRFFAGSVFGKRCETVLFVTPRCTESRAERRSPS